MEAFVPQKKFSVNLVKQRQHFSLFVYGKKMYKFKANNNNVISLNQY